MKSMIFAVIAACTLAGVAHAQTPPAEPAAPTVQAPPSRCTDTIGAAPALPDGATAEADAMTTANSAFTAWAEAGRVKLQCRRTEVEELRAALAARTSEYNTSVEALNGAIAGWQAEVEEFNARTPRRRSR